MLWQFDIFVRARGGEMVSQSAADGSDAFVAILAIGTLIMMVPSVVLYLMWQYRYRANLDTLGIGDARISAGWGVGWWFIPIMNLFRPCQAVAEIYRASAPQRSGHWQTDPAPLVGWWWFFWLASNIDSGASVTLFNRAERAVMAGDFTTFLDLVSSSAVLGIIGDILVVIDWILLVNLINRVVRGQAMLRKAGPADGPVSSPQHATNGPSGGAAGAQAPWQQPAAAPAGNRVPDAGQGAIRDRLALLDSLLAQG